MLPFDTDNKTAGYRLNYLQVYNWGLYNDEVFTISPDLKSSLLIGGNASGKTTIVDALLTLFLSNPKYNLAGDAQKKHDRDITSYILGYFSEYTNEKGEVVPERLRKKDDYSLILASFYNDGLKSNITIGQFFWFKTAESKKPERLYFISYNRDIKIEEDLFLNGISGVSEFKKRLELLKVLSYGKKVPNREGLFTDKYSVYSDKFAELFGLRNKDKALNLFNQTVSLKNIGNLNNFIKNEMLDFVNMEPSIKKIKQAFDEAKLFSDEIEQTELKIELIKPIVEKGGQYISLEQELTETKSSLHVINSYFGTLKKTLLTKEKEVKEKEVLELDNTFQLRFSEKHGVISSKKEEKKGVDENIILLKSDTGITTLTEKLELYKAQLKPITEKNTEYNILIKDIFPVPKSKDVFISNTNAIIEKKKTFGEEFEKKKEEKDEFLIQVISPIKTKYESIQNDIDRLKKDKSSLIDASYEHARNLIASELGLKKVEIPFICELLKVKEEFAEWETPIESLLHEFGLTLLIQNKHYKKACEFVSNINIDKVKINFHKIPDNVDGSADAIKYVELLNKIEFKPKCKHVFKVWIEKHLELDFNIKFCKGLSSFYETEHAITLSGLVKRNGILHTKDNNILFNSSNHILGWDNSDKINELQKSGVKLNLELESKKEEVGKLKDEINSIETVIRKFDSLLQIKSFSEIDFKSVKNEIDSLSHRLKTLENNNELTNLIQNSKLLQTEIEQLEEEKQILNNRIATLNAQLDSDKMEINNSQNEIETVSQDEQTEFFPLLRNKIDKVVIHSNEVSKVKSDIESKLKGTERRLVTPVTSLKTEIENAMLSFKYEFADDMKREELRNEIEYINEFSKYYNQLKEDNLSALKDKFDEKIRTRSDKVIADFWQKLNSEKTKIENKTGRNGRINDLLKKRHYQENKSYLQVIPNESRDEEISNFKNEVKSCFYPLGGSLDTEAKLKRNKAIFKNIKSLLEKLEKYNMPGERWANKVTDVRNWVDFTASERDINNPSSEIKAHSGTASKSGGETFKITYTILASAIADEFGLVGSQIRTNSLRFIAIDEIFNNLGVRWSEYVLKMFEDMDLQLLIVCPDSLEKANIAKSHIKNVHWTYKDIVMDGERETDNSFVADITFDKLTDKVDA